MTSASDRLRRFRLKTSTRMCAFDAEMERLPAVRFESRTRGWRLSWAWSEMEDTERRKLD